MIKVPVLGVTRNTAEAVGTTTSSLRNNHIHSYYWYQNRH